jgi:SpoVK/Ycf46/Vps4 family AAA+-type ATPase
LTTNLISHIDEAFESRISFPIYFPPLTAANRRQIWTDFLNDVRMPDEAARSAVMGEIGRWAELDINGRQIRNVILMAEKLALGEEGPRLTPAVVDGVLGTTMKFHEFNRENKAAVEKY